MRKRKNRGIITVFVTLIMVPMVAFTGTMVDVARLKLYSSQAAMAADSYGEVVLSEYDCLLKELYGLFSVTQNEEGLAAIADLAAYTGYSFNPEGGATDGMDFPDGAFMPYKTAKIGVNYEKVENASLSTDSVLMTQIGDFMRFRVIEEVLDGSGILGKLQGFEFLESDMDAVAKRADITDSSKKVLEEMQEFYEWFDKIRQYAKYSTEDGYIEERKEAYEEYAELLQEVYDSDDYEEYQAYLADKTNIDNAKKAVEDAEEDGETVDTATQELADKYFDVDAYKDSFDEKFVDYSYSDITESDKAIWFGYVPDVLEELEKKAEAVNKVSYELVAQIKGLQEDLENCSPDMREGIQAEIEDLEKIVELSETDAFSNVVDLLEDSGNGTKDSENRELWIEKGEYLDDVKDALKNGTQSSDDWDETVSFSWYNFKQNTKASELYDTLHDLCNSIASDSDEEGDEDAADKEVKKADKVTEDAKKKIAEDEKTEARSISDSLAKQLDHVVTAKDITGAENDFMSGFSLSSLGTEVTNKFLLSTYDFGMFSSRVSGIEKEEEKDTTTGTGRTSTSTSGTLVNETNVTTTEDEDKEYFDVSLTKIEMSKDVNYLYGAEIEYLIAGNNNSVSNLNYTRNAIIAVRMSTNFVSTYTIKEIHNAIEAIARAAELAVVATGVAAAAGPIVRIAVSGALRLAVATVESVMDWEDLKARKEVIFYKNDIKDLNVMESEAVVSLLGGKSKLKDGSGSKNPENSKLTFKLSYEDYLYIMLLFLTSSEDILARTANLITLNVNQCQVEEGKSLTTLDFKMADTVTAVKSTCEVDMKFIVVPENFINMFISGTDTDAIIQKLDNGSYSYSVIRGY